MKLKVHIDTNGYMEKPTGKEVGRIKIRLQKNTSPSIVTVEELIQKIRTGHSISPGIMEGMSTKDWKEQQLFLVDIDNEEDDPILYFKDAKRICAKHGLSPAFIYQTFNYCKEKPKFRIAFIMDTPVTDEAVRKRIIETLVKLFPQSDKSCVNADRIFHGTNKRVILLSESARISWESIRNIHLPSQNKNHDFDPPSHLSGRSDLELDEAVRSFDFLEYLKKRNGDFRKSNGNVVFQNCEICGHHDNLMYVPTTNTFYCHSKNVGGSIIDYLIHAEGLSQSEAIFKLKNELIVPKWNAPLPFNEVNLPPFPVKSLPWPLGELVTAVSQNTETPTDMAAVCALAVLSCTVQGKFVVSPKNHYSEPLNLYFLIVANSGERKSAIVRLMTQPIYQYERKENERRRTLMENEQVKLNSLKKQVETLARDGKNEKASKIRVQYRSIEQNQTKPLRLIADDTTPEAMTSLLANNSGVLSIITTEGGIFDTLAGRYSNTISIDTVLKAYSGDPIRVDRKGREGEVINNPTLTMLLSAQDNVLAEIMKNEAFKSRGLTARILYSRPKSKMGTGHFVTPDIPPDLEIAYQQLVGKLLEIPYPTNGILPIINLSPSAQNEVIRFHDWLEPKLVDELEYMESWGAKLLGNMLRIAGMLHCAKNSNAPSETSLSSETVQQAIAISKYFLHHAKCVHNLLGTDKDMQLAKHVTKKLQNQEKRELSKYQIFRLCRGSFQRVDDLNPILDILIEFGYLKERTHPAPTGGRPRANTYLLNPNFFNDK